MESNIVDTSAVSRKRRRDEEEEEELEQAFFIIVSVVTMLLGALTWYHVKYFVKEPARNLELELCTLVPIAEAMTMFLHILAHNLKYRVVNFSYCRSMEIISR